MYVKQSLILAGLLAFPLTACKHTPAPAAVPNRSSATEPAEPDTSHVTDEQLVQSNQRDGLGLALRIPAATYKQGQPISLRVLIEDFDATTPIASGLCGGFSLSYEDTATHESGGGDISSNPRCFDGDPYPDSIPLEKHKLKVLDLDLQSTTHLTIPPGHYLVSITWKPYPVGPPTITEPEAYATLHSNAVPLTIKQ
jgi:hypothetical protein